MLGRRAGDRELRVVRVRHSVVEVVLVVTEHRQHEVIKLSQLVTENGQYKVIIVTDCHKFSLSMAHEITLVTGNTSSRDIKSS